MRIVVFGPERRVGALLADGRVADINAAYAKYARETKGERIPYALAGAMAPADLQSFIDAGERALESSQQALEYLETGAQDELGPRGEAVLHAAGSVKLQPPLPGPGTRILMAGGNFADHSMGIRVRRARREMTIQQAYDEARERGIWGFYKMTSNVVGPEAEVVYPARTQRLDYESEVTIILGREGTDIPAGRIKEYVWGYTMQNDFSARDQVENAGGYNFAIGKNFNGSSSLGPCIVVGEISDPQDVPFETRINGDLRQQGNTRDMIFSFGEFLEYLSRDTTLLPGDMISGGTSAGTAMDSSDYDDKGVADPKLFLKPGDLVEISSPVIGTLRNRIIEKKS